MRWFKLGMVMTFAPLAIIAVAFGIALWFDQVANLGLGLL